jgi:cytochrome P450
VQSPVDLADPDTFLTADVHQAFTDLRHAGPVHWQEPGCQPGFFAVVGYDAVVEVSREPLLFSASTGGITLEDATPESLEMSRGMLVVMDPPRHGDHRRPLVPSFKASVIGQLEGQIRDICRTIMKEATAIGPEVEFVHQVSALLPSRVMGRLMGLPEDDWPYIHQLSERLLAGQDSATEGGSDGGAMVELAGYAMRFAADRRSQPPRPDLTDVLLTESFGGRQMTDLDFATFFVQLVGAGNDTTKTLTSSGLLGLLQHPEQLAAVRADPALLPGAVEEILRWANPVHYMRRTATSDATIAGMPVAAGDKVVMYYTSANRDEAVFTDAQEFDIRRHPNRHLTFGFAEHFCLGAHLARLEARVFFEELLPAFPEIELAGDPVRLRSNFTNGYRELPVRLG